MWCCTVISNGLTTQTGPGWIFFVWTRTGKSSSTGMSSSPSRRHLQTPTPCSSGCPSLRAGYLGIIGRSAQTVAVDGRTLAVQSQNYYMLTRDRPINYLHWLAPDDTHILLEGGPVDYFIFHPDGRTEKVTLGADLAAGQRPVVAGPGGCLEGARARGRAEFALMANTLSPEFTSDRVKIGAGAEWVKRYTNSAPWATPEELRKLIGPNFTAQ